MTRLVLAQARLRAVRVQRGGGRADRLVRFLGVLRLGLVEVRLLRHVFGPEPAADLLAQVGRLRPDLAPRVLQEYEGEHVDIQLRRNLDGEVTNYIEEYKERDWERRQY